MLQLGTEKRRKTDASGGNPAASASQLTVFVLRKSKTSLNIIHPLSAIAATRDRARGSRSELDSLWLQQSLESLTGVSSSFRSQDQVAGETPHAGSRLRISVRRPMTDNSTSRELRLRFRPEMWLQAFKALSILLLNTCFCTACAWLANWMYAAGNIFSGRSTADQSSFEFLSGTTFFGHWNFYWLNLIVHTQVLMSMQFVKLQGSANPRASFFFCLQRLLSRTYRVYLLSVLLLIATIISYRSTPTHVKHWRIEFYATTMLIYFYIAGTTIAVHQIFKEETVQGQSHNTRNPTTSIRGSVMLFVKVYVRSSAKMFAVVFAGLYVQLASRYAIKGSWNFAVYTLGSLILKMAIKEVTKFGVMKLNIKDPRSIFAAVGLPTVLIDTQVRVMLQRDQSVNFTILWTIVMAIFEIVTRLTTVFVTKRHLRRKELAFQQHQEHIVSPAVVLPGETNAKLNDASAAQIASVVVSPTVDGACATQQNASTAVEFYKWKQQVLAFQIAESYANMSAEYIAIGCSTSILYFYWTHPKYKLSGEHVAARGGAYRTSWTQGYSICGQVAVEIFVDLVSCALEISQGVDFQAIQKHRGFLGLLFTGIAVLNVQICAVMYFKDK